MVDHRRGRGGAGKTVPAQPRQPSVLDTARLPDHLFVSEGSYRRLDYSDLDLSAGAAWSVEVESVEVESVEVEQCRFGGTDLSTVTLDRSRVTDCVFERANLANLRATGSSLTRVRLATSRMTGFTWADGRVRDVTFDECRLDLSNWRYTGFSAAAFTNCNLTRADFSHSDLTGARFVNCDLTGAQFSHAKMAGTRFAGCVLAGIGGLTSWDGAVLSGHDLIALSYELASALGIRIEE
ncbi:pentapeptide repeat-containing protein [Planosporangium mesophilum]|uniref:pentapeptide repeat-containing protein n=1 Tax=Planosporangium mesophilum TaxID=689768 RepID=UPI00143C8A16|nr:pentapeptide repeat-containing protein [Planosporangium mesophilum]NJC84346.1 pentapeptide repeat-containing protein [Planosporangium mesophilum]